MADGLGALLYAAFWFFVPLGVGGVGGRSPPSLVATETSAGRPPQTRRPQARQGPDRGPAPHGRRGHGLRRQCEPRQRRKAYLWPVVLVGAGVALVWRQADNARRARWVEVGRRTAHAHPAARRGRCPPRHRRRLRRLRPPGLRRPPRLRPPGGPRRPRRDNAARRSLPGPDDAGPLRGAPDAHPRPGARRGRRPCPRLGAAHPDPDPAQRGEPERGAPPRPRPGARPAHLALQTRGHRQGRGRRTHHPRRRGPAQRRGGRGQARRPHRGRRRRRLPARRENRAHRCRPHARRW